MKTLWILIFLYLWVGTTKSLPSPSTRALVGSSLIPENEWDISYPLPTWFVRTYDHPHLHECPNGDPCWSETPMTLSIQPGRGPLIPIIPRRAVLVQSQWFAKRTTQTLDFWALPHQTHFRVSLFTGECTDAKDSVELMNMYIFSPGKITNVEVHVSVSLSKIRMVVTLYSNGIPVLQRTKKMWYPLLWSHCTESCLDWVQCCEQRVRQDSMLDPWLPDHQHGFKTSRYSCNDRLRSDPTWWVH